MAKDTYTTYEAKARFSEVLRKVRSGQRVFISYHGRNVAELRPVDPPSGMAERLRAAEERGVVSPAPERRGKLAPLGKRRGGLARFLASRE